MSRRTGGSGSSTIQRPGGGGAAAPGGPADNLAVAAFVRDLALAPGVAQHAGWNYV